MSTESGKLFAKKQPFKMDRREEISKFAEWSRNEMADPEYAVPT
jgi:hypothetical protein